MVTIGTPRLDVRPAQPTLGIRTITPFRGMQALISQLLQEMNAWALAHAVETAGPSFVRYHVIDMRGFMDLSVGFPLRLPLPGDGRLQPDVLVAGRYASLVYTGGGISGNRALIEWVRHNGLAFDRWDTPQGDAFRCRYESFLTDPRQEARKSRWQIEVAIKLAEPEF